MTPMKRGWTSRRIASFETLAKGSLLRMRKVDLISALILSGL
jgi:hypothetical protein